MAQIVLWCKHCHTVISSEDDPSKRFDTHDYNGVCKACESKHLKPVKIKVDLDKLIKDDSYNG